MIAIAWRALAWARSARPAAACRAGSRPAGPASAPAAAPPSRRTSAGARRTALANSETTMPFYFLFTWQ